MTSWYGLTSSKANQDNGGSDTALKPSDAFSSRFHTRDQARCSRETDIESHPKKSNIVAFLLTHISTGP